MYENFGLVRYKFRLMEQNDVPSVLLIQSACYLPITVENEQVIRCRLNDFPDTAWVVEIENTLCAYLVAYRSVMGKLTPLDHNFEISQKPNNLYLHDLAVLPHFKNQKLGSQLVELACKSALDERLLYSSLVSVQGTHKFWQKLGYEVIKELDATQISVLRTYHPPAFYMVKNLV